MSSAKLKKDLSNCLIDFDRRVLITELLDDYQLSYEEVNTIVSDFLLEQEKKDKLKFEKTYIVHGRREDEQEKEIYQIVEEGKLSEWVNILKNAETWLYSVEIYGGAKSAAPIFKPMRVLECVQSKSRHTSKSNAKPKSATDHKDGKEEPLVAKTKDIAKESPKATVKVESCLKKTSPKIEISPAGKKPVDKKATVKKSINNFFAPSTTTKKSDETKNPSGVVKPSTPKKMMDFFKKQAEKPASISENLKTPVNTSIQLFADNEEELEEEESSDEEEKLEALKRDIISDVVINEEEDNEKITCEKRRRILDSDDEADDPPIKQEKLDLEEETQEEAVQETYLDEEGFVITKKCKQKAIPAINKSPIIKNVPAVTMKDPPKETKKSASSKETKSSTTAKTRQAGIMNFFSKK